MTKTRKIPTKPCAKCPFKDGHWLHEDRRAEIAEGLRQDLSFYCHNSVDYEYEDEEGHSPGLITSSSHECIGAIVLADRDGFATQMTRMAAGLGMLDLDNLDGSKIPWKGLDDWVYQGEDPPSVETCNTVGPNCIAPAGMLHPNGGISLGAEPADLDCPSCGEPVCSECVDAEGYCGFCHFDEDEEDL